MHRSLLPLIDSLATELPEDIAPIVISSPHVIPSTRYIISRYPSSLARHLLSLTPPSRPSISRQLTDQTINPTPDTTEAVEKGRLSSQPLAPDLPRNTGPSTFFGMSAANMSMPNVNMGMDVSKWSWPGVLKFGKGQGKKQPEEPKSEEVKKPEVHPESQKEGERSENVDSVNVDTSSLEDAMASDARSVAAVSVVINAPSETNIDIAPPSDDTEEGEARGNPAVTSEVRLPLASEPHHMHPLLDATPANSRIYAPSLKSKTSSSTSSSQFEYHSPRSSPSTPTLEFVSTILHLPDGDDLLVTKRRRVLYLRVNPFSASVIHY